MQYDLLIKNGTVVDGSGLPRFRADVAIAEGKIAAIGKIREGAREIIDAEGHVVSPGFVDGHTHMDAQVFWDPLGTCSCWHGITSVVMGNCGFSLAPCSEEDKLLVMRNLERAEDISPEAMEAGIKWSWTTYPEYLDAVERLPKGINYSAYIGHSALRTYVMGERAFTEEATPDDLEAMKREVRSAIQVGAAGFTTSRTRNHQTPDGQPVASRLATWDEVRQLVGVLGELNAGVFEIAGGGYGGAGHVWHVQRAQGSRLLASIFYAGRRNRRRRRTHVHSGPQPAHQRVTVVRVGYLVRQAAGLARHPKTAFSRTGSGLAQS